MPIKPENRHRYPDNWRDIRASILARAEHRCEQCDAPNGEYIGRDADTYQTYDGLIYDALSGAGRGHESMMAREMDKRRSVKVVLTIAHLDHTPENNDPSNLKALCQRCHLAHDRVDNQAKANATRRSHTADMFGEEA